MIDALGWQGEETKPLCGHDWVCVYRKRVMQVEIKIRERQYDTLLISAKKVEHLLAQPDGVIVAAFRDKREIRAVTVRNATYEVKDGGRTDRGDAKDIEPCAYIPIEQMRALPHEDTVWWVLDVFEHEKKPIGVVE